MTPEAWCGQCGESFRLAEVYAEGSGGRCPRCGVVYNHQYNAVVTQTASQVVMALEGLDGALQRLTDTAPLLHVDRETLYKTLDTYLSR